MPWFVWNKDNRVLKKYILSIWKGKEKYKEVEKSMYKEKST